MKFERKPMVNWYDVNQLASTALKTVISSVFGNFADKREIQAALTQDELYHDFSNRSELWVDYVSDLGDGFNSTYTVAHSLAKETLTVDGHELKRGNILIMGGDEVYPTPEIKEYKNRLQGPYNAAFPWVENDENRPALFAIPGNHDWYDGLTNFIRLFCQRRSLGNWLTEQKRSYFAIKLPHNVWLLGIDIQLKADIDAPQIEYFRNIAKNNFRPDDKVILCTAEPSWVYRSWSDKDESMGRLDYFINQVLFCKQDHPDRKDRADLVAILTGDLHHYSRYREVFAESKADCHLITAGGGGAFTHPTHSLKKSITLSSVNSAMLQQTFPDKKQSFGLALRNLVFPFYSWSMVFFLGAFHLLTTWFLQSSSYKISFMERASKIQPALSNVADYLVLIWASVRHSPSVMVLNILLVVGIFYFTDINTGKGKSNYMAGAIHALLQICNLYLLIWAFSYFNLTYWEFSINDYWQVILFSGEMLLMGGVVSAFIFGIYLLFSTLLIGNHPTEAFSSFRWSGYKNFLKIHITKDLITIYPVGIKKIVTDWKQTEESPDDKPRFEGSEPKYEMIEKKPINIKL